MKTQLSLSLILIASMASAEPMTLPEIVRVGLKRSPTLKQAQADVQAVSAQTDTFKGALFPQVSAYVGVTSQEAPTTLNGLSSGSGSGGGSSSRYSDLYDANVTAKQALYVGGGLTSGIAQRQSAEDISRYTEMTVDQNYVGSLVNAYYLTAEETLLLEAAKENTDILRNHAAITARYEKIGRARKTDKLVATANVATAEADTNLVESQLVAQRESLRQLLALETVPEIRVEQDQKIASVEKIEPNQAIKVALASNPDVRVATEQVHKIDQDKGVDLSQDLPNLYLTGQSGYKSEDSPTWFQNSSQYSSIKLELNIPLFSGLSSMAKRRNYEQQKVSAVRALEAKKLAIEAGLYSQIKELEASFERLKYARTAAAESKDALEMANRDYQRGLLSTTDVIAIQSARYSAQKLFVTTQFSYLTALLQTRLFMGVDLEKTYAKNQ